MAHKWHYAKSPSLKNFYEGDLPQRTFQKLTPLGGNDTTMVLTSFCTIPLLFHPLTLLANIPLYLSHGSGFIKFVSPSSSSNLLDTALDNVLPSSSPCSLSQSVNDMSEIYQQ